MAPLTTILLAPLLLLATTSSATDVHGQAILFNENARANNQSLLWGAYRPGLYLGVKPRLPKSLNTGVLWSRVDDFSYPAKSRFPSSSRLESSRRIGWGEVKEED